MPTDAKQYLQELAQQAGLDATLSESLLKALENPRFAEGLSNGVARQAEFSRAMDELRTQRSTYERQQTEWTTWFTTNKPVVDQMRTALTAYEQKYGPLDPNNPNRGGEGLTQAQIDKQLKEISDRSMAFTTSVTKQVAWAMDDYRSRFGKALDLEALEKTALDQNLTVRQAYEKMIEPEVKTQTEATRQKELKEAGDKAVQEYASKHSLPVDNGPTEPAPFFQRPVEGAQPLTDAQRARNFADTWSQETAKP